MATHTLSKEVTDEQFNRIISIESAGNPDARPPKGSAGGLGQFLKGTWDDVGKKHYPALMRKFGAAWSAMRMGKKTATLQLLMLARFTEDNVRALGKGWQNGDLYLAHFLGIGDARKVFHADPNTPMSSLVGEKAIENNRSILQGKNAGQVRAWAQKSMETRWPKLGSKDWVKIWYNPQEAAKYLGTSTAADVEDETPIKSEDEEDDAIADAHDAPDVAPSPVDTPADSDDYVDEAAKEIVLPKGVTIKGDTETWWIQFRLQRMNYGPSMLDGRYGGKTAAAIAGFLNDRPDKVDLKPPTSTGEFLAMRNELKQELTEAEDEHWVRPVTEARREAAPEVVNEVAPEAAPIQRNKSWGIFGAIGTALTAFFQWAGDSISSMWDFFFENKDAIPDGFKEPSTLSWLWSHVTSLPGYVWLGLACFAFIFFAFNSNSGLKTIIDKVKSGER